MYGSNKTIKKFAKIKQKLIKYNIKRMQNKWSAFFIINNLHSRVTLEYIFGARNITR